MTHERAHKYFDGIVSAERIDAPRAIPVKEEPIDELLEVVWDALNGRGKRAAAEVVEYELADEYKELVEEMYLELMMN